MGEGQLAVPLPITFLGVSNPFLLLFESPSSDETDTMLITTVLCKQTG